MYVKQYDENGLVSNLITKQKPFYNKGESRQTRRFTQRRSNNKKGNGLVVSKIGAMSFVKYKIVKQNLKNKLIVNAIAV